MGEFHLLHSITSLLVRFYKWLELLVIRVADSQVEHRTRSVYRRVGVNFHGEGINKSIKFDSTNNNPDLGKKNKHDFIIHDKRFFARAANHPSLGMGEAYMDGWWDCEDLAELARRIFKNRLYLEYLNPLNRFLNFAELSLFNLQSKERAWEVGRKHYDIGNDLFESFLDPWMNYSCGYWKDAKDLATAQENKMELIAQKLKLEPGMKVLDIGCGWGGLCNYLTEKHGVECVGITVSAEGVKYATQKGKEKGLKTDFRLMDYRDIQEKFDRVVSVGMFEHVGRHNYRTFFEVAHRCLIDNGILLLHTIGNNQHDLPCIEPFFHTYIFPNGYLPYYQDITKFTEGLYVLEDWHNFGSDYSKTLHAWNANFTKNFPKIQHKYGERFFRMWTYYLQTAAGGFESRKFQLWQVVLSKDGVDGGYRSVR